VGPDYIGRQIDEEFRKLGVKEELEYVVRKELVVIPTSFYTFLLFQGYDVKSTKEFSSPVTDGVWLYTCSGSSYYKVPYPGEVPTYRIPDSCRLKWRVVGELEKLYKVRVRELV
jgi:hypothetical protein